ncbi:MAG: 50S ribosome-binding GTPase, partial [Candidatus Amulumruptor sp.]|nr:50S ribosome-binding GTPase [Candidatus Amulumruptor sp.]
SLVELDLDFSEEDVSFASRTELRRITDEVIAILERLTASFGTAQAIRDGIPLAIVGAPNAGKSTLLNTLADDDRAIVSPIAGTTRDTIEDTIEIEGTTFRVIDTAGLRENPTDEIEAIGIDRSLKAISRATVVVWVVDPTATDSIARTGEAIINTLTNGSRLIIAVNKADIFTDAKSTELSTALHAALEAAKGVCDVESAMICATTREGSEPLRKLLGSIISAESLDTPMLTNARHYQAASAALTSLRAVASALGHPNTLTASSIHPTASPNPVDNGTTTATDAMISADSQTISDTMDKAITPIVDVMTHTAGQSETGPLSTPMKQSAVGDCLSEYPEVSGSGNESESEGSLSLDLVAIDLRAALHHLGEITGAITTPDLLATIFSRFCIGK